MSLQFVDINGQPFSELRMDAAKAFANQVKSVSSTRKKASSDSFHKGWRVKGVPPDAWAQAQKAHAARVARAKERGGELPEPLVYEQWLTGVPSKAVRSKPYELLDAARECADLARKAGWLRVQIFEVKSV